MSLFSRAFQRGEFIDSRTPIDKAHANTWLYDAIAGGRKTTAGIAVSEGMAEGLPTAYACNRLLAGLVASMPLKLFRLLPEGGKEVSPLPRLYTILHDLPNPAMTAFELRYSLQWQLGFWGNAYARIVRHPLTGEPQELWPLISARMRLYADNKGLVYEYTHADGSVEEFVARAERMPILHLRVNSLDGIRGRSPITLLREAFGDDQAVANYGSTFFANGGVPLFFILSNRQVKNKQATYEKWDERHGGADKAHRMAIIDGEGVRVEKLTMSPEDSQFLESRRFNVEVLARVWGVPPHMIGHTDKQTSWGTGVEQQSLAFLNYQLVPWLTCWEQALARDLLNRKTWETHRPLFVTKALVKGDLKTRTDAYKAQIESGILSPNEARVAEDMNPRPGGDEFWKPLNMGSVGDSASGDEPEGDGVGEAVTVEPQE
jgi:HK97 family phage portal protein